MIYTCVYVAWVLVLQTSYHLKHIDLSHNKLGELSGVIFGPAIGMWNYFSLSLCYITSFILGPFGYSVLQGISVNLEPFYQAVTFSLGMEIATMFHVQVLVTVYKYLLMKVLCWKILGIF